MRIFSYLFVLIFFIFFSCKPGSGKPLKSFNISLRGNSKNVKIEYKTVKGDTFLFFDNRKEETVSENVGNLKENDEYTFELSNFVPMTGWADSVLVRSVLSLDFKSETKTDFIVSIQNEHVNRSSSVFYFTNQNITFDKGKLILDGVETEVSDYKYKK